MITKEEKAEVLIKIEKLMAHTKVETGAVNVNEMAIANKLIKELMDKYDIKVDEIKATSDKSVLVNKFESLQFTNKTVKGWEWDLSGMVASFYDCRLIRSNFKMLFIGFEMDAIVARKMFDYLYIEIYVASYNATKEPSIRDRKDRKMDFCVGVIHSLSSRLREIKAERKKNDSINALVVVKDSVVNDQIATMFPRLKNVNTRTKYRITNDYHNGREYGKTMNLSKPELIK